MKRASLDSPPATRASDVAKADRYVAELTALVTHSPEFGIKAGQLSGLGQREIAALASPSYRFARRSDQAPGMGDVAANLRRLRSIVETVDPARYGDVLRPRRLLGMIPRASNPSAYFDRYVQSQQAIDGALRAIATSRDALLEDMIAIDAERRRMAEQMDQLDGMIALSRTLDAGLEAAARDLDHRDPAKARAVRDTALFDVRQRTVDLSTQMAVARQGVMALDLMRVNDVELVDAIDRTSMAIVAALRTAVAVAQALAGHHLVLDRITAINGAPAGEGGSRIVAKAPSTPASVEALQRAFADVHATMDGIDAVRAAAIGSMARTLDALSHETEKAKRLVDRAGGREGSVVGEFTLG